MAGPSLPGITSVPSISRHEMVGTEVMPGRLDSSLRFLDIKTLCLEKPSAKSRLYSRLLLVRRT